LYARRQFDRLPTHTKSTPLPIWEAGVNPASCELSYEILPKLKWNFFFVNKFQTLQCDVQ
jgi:hypothetical protein